MYWRRCGSVMKRKVWMPSARSILAASSTSPGWDCRPASRISIMNGVHCHTRAAITAGIGKLDT